MNFAHLTADAATNTTISLALVAGLTALFVSVLKTYIEKLVKPGDPAHDSSIHLLAVVVAAVLIALATYAPGVFTVLSEASAASTTAIGGYRVITTQTTS